MFTRARISLFSLIFIVLAISHAATAEPVIYQLDSEHTHIVWEVDRFGFTKTMGSFVSVTGELKFDSEAPENSRVTAQIDLAGLRSDLKEREDIVRGEYWLDAAKHPTIQFETTAVERIKADDEADDEGALRVTGMMTLKGKTAPLVLNVVLNKAGNDPVTKAPAVGFSADGSFDRSDFGVTTAIGPVGKEVSFRIEALAVAAKNADTR